MPTKKSVQKKKPKPTIESLQKAIRSLKRTITGQRELTDFLRRQCQDFYRMYEDAQYNRPRNQSVP